MTTEPDKQKSIGVIQQLHDHVTLCHDLISHMNGQITKIEEAIIGPPPPKPEPGNGRTETIEVPQGEIQKLLGRMEHLAGKIETLDKRTAQTVINLLER